MATATFVPPPTPPPPGGDFAQFDFDPIQIVTFSNPINIDGAADFEVDWGNGNTESFSSGDIPSHDYGDTAERTVKVTPAGGSKFTTLDYNGETLLTSITVPPSLIRVTSSCFLVFANNGLTEASLAALLTAFATVPGLNNHVLLNVSGAGNPVPAPASVQDVNDINDTGCALYVNAWQITIPIPDNGGTLYADNDTQDVVGGTLMADANEAITRVTAQTAGVVDSLAIDFAGVYSELPTPPADTAANEGLGTGLTITWTPVRVTYAPND